METADGKGRELAPIHDIVHQVVSGLLALFLCWFAYNSMMSASGYHGWKRLTIPLAVFLCAFSVWLLVVAIPFLITHVPRLILRRQVKQSDRLQPGRWFRHYSVRLYSLWFILCASYGAWIIWAFPATSPSFPSVREATQDYLKNQPPMLAPLSMTYPFDRMSPKELVDVAKVELLPVYLSMPPDIVAEVLKRITPGVAPGMVGLLPDPENQTIKTFLGGLNKQTVLTTVTPALLVFLFAVPVSLIQFFRRDIADLSKWLNEIGDDTYFMGFLLTLAGLSSALLSMDPGADNLLQALAKCGGAISTTFVAVTTRVVLLDVVNLRKDKDPEKDDPEKEESRKLFDRLRGIFTLNITNTANATPTPVPTPALAPQSCVMLGSDCERCGTLCGIGQTRLKVYELAECCTKLQSGMQTQAPVIDLWPQDWAERMDELKAGLAELKQSGDLVQKSDLDDLSDRIDQCCRRLRRELGNYTAYATQESDATPGLRQRLDIIDMKLGQVENTLRQQAATSQQPDTDPETARRLDAIDQTLDQLTATLRQHAAEPQQPNTDPEMARRLDAIDQSLGQLEAALRQQAAAPQQPDTAPETTKRLDAIDQALAALRQMLHGLDQSGRDAFGTLRRMLEQLPYWLKANRDNPSTAEPHSSPEPQARPSAPPPFQQSAPLSWSGDDLIKAVARGVISEYSGNSGRGR